MAAYPRFRQQRYSKADKNSVGHYPNTALFNNQKKKTGAGEWPKLFRENNSKKQGCVVVAVSPCFWQIFPTGCFFDCPVDRSWCAQRCCDGAATESLLQRSCVDQLRRAHPARRVRDGAYAAATELVCAALLRRSCDGVAAVAAATELRRPAPSRSFCASRVTSRLSTRRAE